MIAHVLAGLLVVLMFVATLVLFAVLGGLVILFVWNLGVGVIRSIFVQRSLS